MTIFARSLAALRPAATRCLILAAGLAGASSLALALSPAPADAIVTHVGPVAVGQQARVATGYYLYGLPGELSTKYANAEGNPVVHGSNTWAIYWDPNKDYYHGDWQSLIDSYFEKAAAASGSQDSVFSVDSQYTDKSNKPASYQQTFRGAAVDTEAYPTPSGCEDPDPLPKAEQIVIAESPTVVCLTSTQIASELERYVKALRLPTGMNNVYYLMTPPGVTVCLDGGGSGGHCSDFEETAESYDNSFCSYHADINPGSPPAGSASTILYGVIPWTAGTFWDPDFSEQTPGWECQDGGYDASNHERLEKIKVKDKREKLEFEEENEQEKAKEELAELLEGPHEQEPNQQVCPTTDGGCDYALADLIINQISLEQQNIVTDPLLNGWQDPAHYENTDECRFFFAPTTGGSVTANEETYAGTLYNQTLDGQNFYLNDAFNYAAELLPYPGVPCVPGTNLDPKFTAPSPVNAGETVGFDGMESDITLNAGISYTAGGSPQVNYATYTWNFGDGSPEVSGEAPGAPPCELPWLSPCAASVFHAYQYGGTYEVKLTVKDVGGNTTSVTHTVTVNGPPPPSSSGGSSGGSGAASTGQTPGGAGAGGSSGGHAGVPAPVAVATIVSRSLRTALHKGLAVRYSVNEQVAGHFEVLLSRAIAHRLGISGSPASGLPAELVIAKAVLVTTKGGHSAVHIEFSKRTAARLAHAHKVSLMLRLTVRNAATSNPATTTVVSSATLSR